MLLQCQFFNANRLFLQEKGAKSSSKKEEKEEKIVMQNKFGENGNCKCVSLCFCC